MSITIRRTMRSATHRDARRRIGISIRKDGLSDVTFDLRTELMISGESGYFFLAKVF